MVRFTHHLSRPKNYRELFNLQHAQARNVIEWIFGVVKRQFRLLVAPEYNLKTQAKMVPTICVLHNFICIYDSDDLPEPREVSSFNGDVVGPMIDSVESLGGDISSAERNQALELRYSIAKVMWDSYQYIINSRHCM